jgi:hypothetical protein
MIKRLLALHLLTLALCAACATGASAASPTVGPISATDVQGISAVLKGQVNPQGSTTTYYFEYGTGANFSGAVKTTPTPVGSGGAEEPARAAIGSLQPSTTYYYRLVAVNASGTTVGNAASFETTKGFGFLPGSEGFSAAAVADGGEAATLAGSHPYRLSFKLGLNQAGEFEGRPGAVFPDGDLRDLKLEIPNGMILNPSVTPACTAGQFGLPRTSPFEISQSGENCPDRTQVGTVKVATSEGERTFGVFNLVPAPGLLAQFGFAPFGAPISMNVSIEPNPDGSYSLTLQAKNLPQALDLHELELALWGTPWAASHDRERGNCLNEAEPGFSWAKCAPGPEPVDFPPAAYLSLPPKCSGPLTFNVSATSWQQPGTAASQALSRTALGAPAETFCHFLQFNPEVTGHLDNIRASGASGFVFRLDVNHELLTNPGTNNPAPPKTLIVRLPKGSTVNPSVGAGLGVCTRAEFAAETPSNGQGQGCPNGSKIGTVKSNTPLFEDELVGAVYLAKPDDANTTTPGAENPFDTLVAAYLVAKSPQRGVMIKLAGKIELDPTDGTVTGVFDNLPQLPYTDLEVAFKSGQRSFFITPPECGYVPTTIEALPWGNGSSISERSYTLLKSGADGGACPSGTPPFEPRVSSGGVNSDVNAFTPYAVHISRKDTEQEITSYSLTLPRGVTAKLAGVAQCPDGAIEAARHRLGAAEAANPSCPAASQVGRTVVGFGIGSALTYAEGKIYLAGPYHGAPLSLVTVNPATVGPFDVGTIVIRSAFQIDEHTAQLHIDSSASDPIPHILKGIVLHLREIRVSVDRPDFTHNPSSCEASRLTSTLTGSGASFGDSADDSVATPSNYFQLLNCRNLGFQPRLGVRLRGGTHRGDYPQLRTTFAARGPNDSNLKEIAVVIPRQEFVAQEHIRGICTRIQFAAESCPANSVYGSAVAYTPLLDQPLRGNVYMKSSNNALPDLVADLHSGPIRIVLQGKIGPVKGGGIRAFFGELPDEPIERFVMTLYGGKRGLLVNSADICAKPPVSNVKAIGQNNIGAVFTTKLRGQCNHRKKRSKGRHGAAKRHHGTKGGGRG